ncbi:universal stress protein [Mycolicibacterium sp. CBMA 226]|uniref:universal stress protein n=1 Tax=Mycolicibacterium sp. CBMA 226 TaxID=2606611 RepID=UPI0012DD0883|nr:universal stress protein [Mycolicibacterium sp. CBMA 226]MUL77225.1 universal stress protein [Mycolicibacterium sp. CBMA 226]
MTTYSRIVVGTDGSDEATDAVGVAGVVAAALGVPVTVVTTWKPSVSVPGGREQPWADLTAEGADVDLTALGVTAIEKIALKGNAFDALVDAAAQAERPLIVVGAAGLGQTSSRLWGSTSNELSHHSPVDVMFVRQPVAAVQSIALATDGSETSVRAVRAGYDLAAALGARSILITVAADIVAAEETLNGVASQLDSPGLLERQALVGGPADVLAAAEYDLLVIGNRGMAGFARVLGSTANTITHRATSNLLLVNTGS